MPEIQITINDKLYSVDSDRTILQAATTNGIHIPTLCHFEGIAVRANCRMCIVEVEGMRTFQPSCVTKVRDGMVIRTDTERLRAARRTTLELLLSHHAVDCHHCLRLGLSREENLDPKFCEMCFWCDCVRDGFCELQTLAREYHVDVLPYIQHEHEFEEDCSLGSIIRNPNKCIKCRRCVDVCNDIQTVHNLSMARRGRDIFVTPELGRPMAESACVRCGHCVDVCPVGAIYMKEHIDEILYMTHSYACRTIAQVSPDILPELNRLYRLKDGTITLEHVAAALKKIGFDKVVSAEEAEKISAGQAAWIIRKSLTNAEEAEKTSAGISRKRLDSNEKISGAENYRNGAAGEDRQPVIVTSSPAVINFVGKYFPQLRDRIDIYENAQQIFGRSVREREADEPWKTVNITNARELAAEAAETGDVDYVVNARELYRMFLRTGGAPAMRQPEPVDHLTAPYPAAMGSGKTGSAGADLDGLLGPSSWNLNSMPEEAEVLISGRPYPCAIAHNLGQARRLLSNPADYAIIRLGGPWGRSTPLSQ